jgi:hypothetical protein
MSAQRGRRDIRGHLQAAPTRVGLIRSLGRGCSTSRPERNRPERNRPLEPRLRTHRDRSDRRPPSHLSCEPVACSTCWRVRRQSSSAWALPRAVGNVNGSHRQPLRDFARFVKVWMDAIGAQGSISSDCPNAASQAPCSPTVLATEASSAGTPAPLGGRPVRVGANRVVGVVELHPLGGAVVVEGE